MSTVAQRIESVHYIPGERGVGPAKIVICVTSGEEREESYTYALFELIKVLQVPDSNVILLGLWEMVKKAIESGQLNEESKTAFAMIMTRVTESAAQYVKEGNEE